MSLASDVTKLETELQSVRAESEALGKKQAVLEFENAQLRQALAKANTDRDALIRRSEAIKSLLDQCGATLMHGLKQYADSEREVAQRQEAADQLDGDMAKLVARRGNGAIHTDGERTEH
jgi:chromosome segregation ATPase